MNLLAPFSRESSYFKLVEYINSHQEWLMQRILDYAIKRNYAKYTSTLLEAWRLSISGLSTSMTESLALREGDFELDADEDYLTDPAAQFGIQEAKLHRERGVSLQMFLGLMKYYNQSYVDLVDHSKFSKKEKRAYTSVINRFFNRVEIALCLSWTNYSEQDLVSDLQERNRQMTNEKNKYLTVFESHIRPFFLVDQKGLIEQMNHVAGEFLNVNVSPGSSYYNDTSENQFIDAVPWAADAFTSFLDSSRKKEVTEIHVMEQMKYYSLSLSRSLDVSGKFQNVIVGIEDITQRKLMERQLEKLSITDPLTGAKNRRYFSERLEIELSRCRRYKQPSALLLFDIDDFKMINDTHGHDVGDAVLVGLVDQTQTLLRESDVFARWGGEEFIAFLPETTHQSAFSVAERLRLKLSDQKVPIKKHSPISYTISTGVKTIPDTLTNDNIDQLIHAADRGLYMAKQQGKNQVVMV